MKAGDLKIEDVNVAEIDLNDDYEQDYEQDDDSSSDTSDAAADDQINEMQAEILAMKNDLKETIEQEPTMQKEPAKSLLVVKQ